MKNLLNNYSKTLAAAFLYGVFASPIYASTDNLPSLEQTVKNYQMECEGNDSGFFERIKERRSYGLEPDYKEFGVGFGSTVDIFGGVEDNIPLIQGRLSLNYSICNDQSIVPSFFLIKDIDGDDYKEIGISMEIRKRKENFEFGGGFGGSYLDSNLAGQSDGGNFYLIGRFSYNPKKFKDKLSFTAIVDHTSNARTRKPNDGVNRIFVFGDLNF